MEHKCEICNKIFKFRSRLVQHLKRKFSCSNESLTCNKCGKIFSRIDSLKRHLKKKFDCTPISPPIQMSITKDESIKIDGDYNSINSNNTTNITNNITNNITIKPFGRECAISMEEIDKIAGYAALPVMMFRMKNANPEHPENHNVTYSNKREKMGLIKRKGGWKKEPIEEIHRDILNYQEYDIDVYYNERYNGDQSIDQKSMNLHRILTSLAQYMSDKLSR